MKNIALLLALLALAGCSTVKDWVGSKPEGPQPAKLVEFSQSAKITERWHGSFGDAGGNILQAALTADSVYGVSIVL